jgi:DNA-binding NtrC family response regulator
LPAAAQSKLLCAVEEHVVERLGGSATIRVDARIIAATNRDLETAVAVGESSQGSLPEISARALESVERAKIEATLRECRWNKTAAAARLEISYKTLLNKVHAYAWIRAQGRIFSLQNLMRVDTGKADEQLCGSSLCILCVLCD